MNFDNNFLSQDDTAEISPMINQQSSFLSDLDHDVINSQFVTPNPNTNTFNNNTFNNEQLSAYPPYDFFDLLDFEADKTTSLQTPKSSVDPTFDQPLGGTNFSTKTTPAIIPTGTFPPFYSENRNSSHTNVTIQTQASPIVPNIMNAQSYNTVDNFSEPMLSTPSSLTGLRNSPQQFTSPSHSQYQIMPKSKSGPIGLGLNTELTMATPQAPPPPPQIQLFQNVQRQSPLQQAFPSQPPLQLQTPMTKLSPYERANAMFQQQIQQQDFVQLQNDLESTRKFRSELSLNLQALIKEEKEKLNTFNASKRVELPKQRMSKHRRSSARTIEIKEQNDTLEESFTNQNIANLPNQVSTQNGPFTHKGDDIDSPTTIEVASPQSSIDDFSSNSNVTGKFFESKNITAEELLNDDHFENLVTQRLDTKDFFADMVDLDHNVDIELNDPAYNLKDILISDNTALPKSQSNSVGVGSTPKKKKPPVSSTSSSSANKKNTKKVLKKSSSFNGSPSLIPNPKFSKTRTQVKTIPPSYGGASIGTFPVVNTGNTSTKGHSSTSTSPQKRSVSCSQADMISSMPVLTMGNHYSFIYEHAKDGRLHNGGGPVGGSGPGGHVGRSTSHHRSLSGRRLSSFQEKNFSPNAQSKMFEFQVELKK